MAVYACSDIHGVFDFYEMIKAKLNPEDKVYFLGDAGDRGENSWKTVKALLTDPQFIFIKGNHEDMLCDALSNYIDGSYNSYALKLLTQNGGRQTYLDAIKEPTVESWYNKLIRLDTIQEYVNTQGERILLSHAGFTPWKSEFESEDYIKPSYNDVIWDRSHYLYTNFEGECVDAIVVHGHTPIPYLAKDIGEKDFGGAFWYNNGKKCCVDRGAVFTGRCVLLNLDTWEEEVLCI